MAPKSKSIFRQPGAKHFQLVHRSQRDPLYNDPDASQHVLKAFERGNTQKGKTRADLEKSLGPDILEHDKKHHFGEAALYGVYYDDEEYDYMQHLREVGVKEDGVESVLIEAPIKTKVTRTEPLTLKVDLPPEVFASPSELPRNYEAEEAIPSSIAGFQPDMDPHLRQALEALEDDAFVEDGVEDDFFAELVADGERGSDESVGFEFHEDGHDDNAPEPGEAQDDSFEAQFLRFKLLQKTDPEGHSDDSMPDTTPSERGDTVGGLPRISVIGGKKRRKGTSDASGYSMSSSSMFRNGALVVLDERFDQVMAKTYASDEEADNAESFGEDSDDDSAPELITSREDFEALMDDFLDKYEVLGRKMHPSLEGETGVQKLEVLRRAMGMDPRMTADVQHTEVEEEDTFTLEGNTKERWDCETILSTYSNLENHPRLIKARQDHEPLVKIHIDSRTGLPLVVNPQTRGVVNTPNIHSIQEEETDEDVQDSLAPSQTITRPRNETKEEKRTRKQAVKQDRQIRRASKKTMKEQFSAELNMQKSGLVEKGRARTRKL